MINGITYFRKNSPYNGDVTKNCALDGYEVDNNFFVLEGRDIKSITIVEDDIVINLFNGDSIKAKDAFKAINENIEKSLTQSITNIEFDKENGVLKITQDGKTQLITGFLTEYNTKDPDKGILSVATDGSIIGKGISSLPIGISPQHKAGQLKPVKKYIDLTKDDPLPCCKDLNIGDRYVTKEYCSEYGLLYNYEAVKRIACELRESHSPWRIPTKEDWDSMLNAIEPCKKDKNHNNQTSNKWLGKWAGKLLKSKDLWIEEQTSDCCCDDEDNFCLDCNNTCDSTYCGKIEDVECHHKGKDTEGIDSFGFRVIPTGYADDGKNFVFFGERSYFWTATNLNCSSVYAKRFDSNKASVYQSIIPGQNFVSLRLVKDYHGDNYYENDDILSSYYPTVLMPNENGGKSVWTAINISLGCKCGCAIQPNDGKGFTKTIHYFINEWDGHKWKKIELHEGDCIVVTDVSVDKKCIEYRIINNEFVDVNSMVYEDVIETIQPKLDEIDDKVDNEINRSTEKDELIDNIISNELKPNIKKNASDIATVNNNLVTAINSINNSIVTVNNNLVESINTINGGIATEIKERKEVDAKLQEQISENKNSIDDEVERAIKKDSELEQSIASEKQERINNDSKLDSKINETNSNLAHTNKVLSDFGAETAKAFEQVNKVITDGFNTINGGIAAEIKERKESDEEIKGTILTKEGTEFNTDDGILTLKSKDSTNDIKVQFSMNFGEF